MEAIPDQRQHYRTKNHLRQFYLCMAKKRKAESSKK